MSFGDESTTGVHNKLASVRVVASVDQLSSFTYNTEEDQMTLGIPSIARVIIFYPL